MNWLLRLNKTTRLVLLSIILGVIGALGAQLFLWMLHTAEQLLLTPISGYKDLTVETAHQLGHLPEIPHLLWLIPVATTLGGLLSGFLVYTWAPEAEGHGTDAAVKAFHRTDGYVRARIPLIKSVASAITIGSGGSAGREGPTAQIAAGVGSILGTFLKLPHDERRFLVLVGMAAGLSAIFKSPLGTAIFGVEILYSSVAFEGGALIYTLIGAAVAYAITGIFEGWTPLFILPSNIGFTSAPSLIWYGLLAVFAGLVGSFLPSVFYYVRDGFVKIKLPPHVKPAIGGLIVGLIGIVVPQILAGGYGFIQLALQGGAGMAIWFMLLLSMGKIVTLSLSIGSGGSGGVFAPSLFVGALLGAAFAAVLHELGVQDVSATGLAVVGMASLFAGAARVPIASLVMVAEMTGGYRLIMPTMFAVAIAYIIQYSLTRGIKYPSLYEAQVAGPAESPVHHEQYYQTVAQLLRKRQVQLEEDIFLNKFTERLASGQPVPLSEGEESERLYSMDIEPGSPIAGKEVRSLGFADILIVSVVRGEKQIIPNGDTRLRVGDHLVVAATPESVEDFRRLAEHGSTQNA
ncbi:MAG TPA: chloride channel protein [Gammaproteobacteria bacterium]|nr:chloride channel protein [Gammaproteobacteria bacterium]